jgi:hypothetical protein
MYLVGIIQMTGLAARIRERCQLLGKKLEENTLETEANLGINTHIESLECVSRLDSSGSGGVQGWLMCFLRKMARNLSSTPCLFTNGSASYPETCLVRSVSDCGLGLSAEG